MSSTRVVTEHLAQHALGTSAAIVLLAAGEGRRFGAIKQLAKLDGEPMIRRAVRPLLDTGAPVVVVTGAHAREVEDAIRDFSVRLVRNHDWQEGMGSSLAAGFRYLRERLTKATGALLCLADQPFPSSALPLLMLNHHAQVPDRLLAVAHSGIVGPPVLFPRDYFAELSEWSGAAGANAILYRDAQRLETFAVDLPGDVDTSADLERVAVCAPTSI